MTEDATASGKAPPATAAPRVHGSPRRRSLLIDAKLEMPPAPTKLLVRPRLITRLDHGAGRQMTLVTAPAGAGKSALLASWMSKGTLLGAGAWLTLDEADNDPDRLWAYLMAALRRAGAQTGAPAELSRSPRPPSGHPADELAAALGRLPAPLVLVLDDVQCLTEGPAAEWIGRLIRHGLPMVHLVVSTRTQPPLPLGRLRVAGELSVIDAEAGALAEALSAAAADLLVQPFLDMGAPLAVLLDRHRDLLAAYGRFGRRLDSAILSAPARHADPLAEPITEREGVILRYLPTLLTMQDIARELSVSPNTVKSHLRSLYRKLAVGSRRDAVRRARRLGLLRP
jgi:LuxR family maltose regulon positive regulatory protein